MCPWGCSATGMVLLGSTPPRFSPLPSESPHSALADGICSPRCFGTGQTTRSCPGTCRSCDAFCGCWCRATDPPHPPVPAGAAPAQEADYFCRTPPGRWKMCELFPAGARLPPHRRARGAGDRNGARGTGSTRGSPSSGEDGMRGLPPPRGSIPTPRPGSKVQTPEQHGHPGWFCLLGKRQPPTERRAAKQGRELQPHGQGARGQGSVR